MDGALLNWSMGETWTVALKCELNKPYFIELSKYVEIEQTHYAIYPPLDVVFSCTHHCTIQDIKVVILGQDPYHGEGQAHGLCFSIPEEVDQPRSLLNIFKVLNSDNIPEHEDLTKWAEQGVLLLNSAVTVREGEANSHKNQGWEEFTDAVIEWISSNLNNVVFMLWGRDAQMKYSKIDESRHLILESSHPPPQSASCSFSVCGHVSEANDYLRTHGKPEIDWNLKQGLQTTKLDEAIDRMGESWKDALNIYELKKDPDFKKLIKFLEIESKLFTIYPPLRQVFSWTHHCRIQDIKVVILGQDPYHGPGQAHGLCFSVPKGVKKPRSLQNIFKELASDEEIHGGFTIPDHGDLTKWAEQGVLLLNCVLTVRGGKANSHEGKGWDIFTDTVISWISSNLENVVFMLWGVDAQEKGSLIDETKGHLILKASHPSFYSASRGCLTSSHPGFFEICAARQSVQPGTAIKFDLSPGFFDIQADWQFVQPGAAINNLVLTPGFFETLAARQSVHSGADINFVLSPQFFQILAARQSVHPGAAINFVLSPEFFQILAARQSVHPGAAIINFVLSPGFFEFCKSLHPGAFINLSPGFFEICAARQSVHPDAAIINFVLSPGFFETLAPTQYVQPGAANNFLLSLGLSELCAARQSVHPGTAIINFVLSPGFFETCAYRQSVHPNNKCTLAQPFMGCHHFSTANKYLRYCGKPEIDWKL